MSSPTRRCRSCGAEYLASVSTCADCDLPLPEPEPDPATGGGDEGAGAEGDDVAYDLDDWTEEQRGHLSGALDADGIPFGWEDGALVVAERDADVVEQLIDEIDHPDALPADDDGDDDGGAEILSALYVTSDVLLSDPRNGPAAFELFEAAVRAAEGSAPYGVDPGTWRRLVDAAAGLAAAVRAGVDDDEVVDAARRLRDAVRPLV